MKLKDVAEFHIEQAKEAEACNERWEAERHWEMVSALLEDMK